MVVSARRLLSHHEGRSLPPAPPPQLKDLKTTSRPLHRVSLDWRLGGASLFIALQQHVSRPRTLVADLKSGPDEATSPMHPQDKTEQEEENKTKGLGRGD